MTMITHAKRQNEAVYVRLPPTGFALKLQLYLLATRQLSAVFRAIPTVSSITLPEEQGGETAQNLERNLDD